MEGNIEDNDVESLNMHSSIIDVPFDYDNIIYPENIRKYIGSITKPPYGGNDYMIHIKKGKGRELIRKSFPTYDSAFDYIKMYNIERGLVRNIVYMCSLYINVRLTKGQYMKCDKEDMELVQNYLLFADYHGRNKYRVGCSSLIPDDNDSSRYFHNIIMEHIPTKTDTVDHIDSREGGLDNRRDNLRIVNKNVQSINKQKHRNNTTGITGVCFDKRRNRYYAYWKEEGKVKRKIFSCKKYGKKEAKKKAIKVRKRKERTLPNYRDVYLERKKRKCIDSDKDDEEEEEEEEDNKRKRVD